MPSEHVVRRLFLGKMALLIGICAGRPSPVLAGVPVVRSVEGQPLAANVKRVLQALEFLGAPLSE